MAVVIQILLNSLQFISIIGLATMGIVLIFKTSITTNFAQGMIATSGAFITTLLFAKGGWTIWLGLPVSVIAMFLVGILIDKFIIRKARNVNSIGKQMITMGLVLLFSGLIPMVFGKTVYEAPRFSTHIIQFSLGGSELSLSAHVLIGFIIAVVIIAALFLALKYTKWGLGVRATASNETVANMMGVNTHRITALSWGIAGGLGSIAAIIYAPLTQVIPTMMVATQVNGFVACILGGFSTFYGPIIGAVILPILSNIVAYIFGGVWKDIIVYVIVLIVVLIKPIGLFGKKTIKKV